MALSQEEELELQNLEEEQMSLSQELQSLKTEITPEEPVINQPDTSVPEAFLRGATQGLSFDFADEITAGIETALSDKPYRQALEESRQEYELSKEQYPLTTALGGITGGVGQAIGLSTLAGPAGAAAGAGRLAKAAQTAKNLLLPSTKAGSLKNITTAARAGAVMGGATAIGASEKKGLESLEDAPIGATSGAVVGGALGGVVEGVGKVAKGISKGIDEGKYPNLFRQIRQGWSSGTEGKGFIAERDLEAVDQRLFDAVEGTVRPELTERVAELRTLKNHILDNIDQTVDVNSVMKTFNKKLKEIGFDEADSIRRGIISSYNNRVASTAGGKSYLRLSDANKLIQEINDSINRPEISAGIKEAGINAIKDLKTKIKIVASEEAATKTLLDNPQMLSLYIKYAKRLPDEELKAIIENNPVSKMSGKQALAKAKEIKNILKTMSAAFAEEDPTVFTDIISKPQVQEPFKKSLTMTSPISALDNAMNKILNASEKLGDVSSGRTDPEKLEDVINIFRNITEQTKDTSGAFIARKKFDSALRDIESVVPESASKIREAVTPSLNELEFRRFIKGSGLEQGSRDSGIIKDFVKNVGQYTAQAANIAGQVSGAAAAGTIGPIPGASTVMRPATSLLTAMKKSADKSVVEAKFDPFLKAKDAVDAKLISSPESGVWKSISQQLDTALQSKDEGRRAAILNTLMQYDFFRKLIEVE